MAIDCERCNAFVADCERYLAGIMARLGAELAECKAEGHGRGLDCRAMYQAEACRLLYVFSDGGDSIAMGAVDAPFPAYIRHLTGEDGWYNVVFLIEFLSGQKVFTRKVIDAINAGKINKLKWLAGVMEPWTQRLVALFTPGQPQTWQAEFARWDQAQLEAMR